MAGGFPNRAVPGGKRPNELPHLTGASAFDTTRPFRTLKL